MGPRPRGMKTLGRLMQLRRRTLEQTVRRRGLACTKVIRHRTIVIGGRHQTARVPCIALKRRTSPICLVSCVHNSKDKPYFGTSEVPMSMENGFIHGIRGER